MKIALLLIVAALLSGCAFSHQITLPNGQPGYSISCDGAGNSFGACLEKGGEICKTKGFDIINADGSATPFSIGGGSFSASGQNASGGFYATSGTYVSRNVLIMCKN